MILPHSFSIPQSLYIHYPICRHHCSYCDFNVFPLVSIKDKDEFDRKWVSAVLRHLERFFKNPDRQQILKTLYLGGGTPSLLSLPALERLILGIKRSYEFSNDLEFSLEVNPEDVEESYLLGLKDLGVNRLSLGVQSLQKLELKRLERLATSSNLMSAFDLLKKHFENYSIDLMLGIPSQSMESLEANLRSISEISPPHLSIYLLTIAEDHKWRRSQKIAPLLADDSLCSKMYSYVCKDLASRNYRHYEVSNFSKLGFESRHNSNYWDIQSSYLGLGPGAHGYLRGNKVCRYENWKNIESWLASSDGIEDHEFLDDAQQKIEELYLALRTRQPIDMCHIRQDQFQVLHKEGLCTALDGKVILSEEGWVMLDAIAPRLLQCL